MAASWGETLRGSEVAETSRIMTKVDTPPANSGFRVSGDYKG